MKYVFHNIFVEFVDFFSLAVRKPTPCIKFQHFCKEKCCYDVLRRGKITFMTLCSLQNIEIRKIIQ